MENEERPNGGAGRGDGPLPQMEMGQGTVPVSRFVARASCVTAEIIALVATPAVLIACAVANLEQTAALSFFVVLASVAVFFASYEASRPRLRDIMPTVVLAALAAAGRILFAPIPDFKPVSAIAIIAGVAFGRKSGFMVGALAALASNFFFGQGPWTPWQMYAWGLVGYGAGLLAMVPAPDGYGKAEDGAYAASAAKDCAFVTSKAGGALRAVEAGSGFAPVKFIDAYPFLIYAYGFVACLGYGFILNAWSILSFFHAQASGIAGVVAVYAAALPFDVVHGVATVVFLVALYAPWRRKLARVRRKFGLG